MGKTRAKPRAKRLQMQGRKDWDGRTREQGSGGTRKTGKRVDEEGLDHLLYGRYKLGCGLSLTPRVGFLHKRSEWMAQGKPCLIPVTYGNSLNEPIRSG